MSNGPGLPILSPDPPHPSSGEQWVRGDLDPPELRVYLNEKIYRMSFIALEETREVARDRGSRDQQPDAVTIDPEDEQHELEAAGWERADVLGKVFWVNPQSGYRYPQGPAVRRLRQMQGDEEYRDA
jgi:hypothetical protein